MDVDLSSWHPASSFLAAMIGCALTDHFAGMLVARFFVGAGASTFSTMVGGVISDVYHAEHRNTPMALYSGCALAGTGMGPMISGFIVERVSWRWVFYHQIISLGITMGAMFLLFKETRGSVLLSRRAKGSQPVLRRTRTDRLPPTTCLEPRQPFREALYHPSHQATSLYSRSGRQPRIHHDARLPQPNHPLPPPRHRTRGLLLLTLGGICMGPPPI